MTQATSATQVAAQTAAAKANAILSTSPLPFGLELKDVIAIAAIIASLAWNFYNFRSTRKLQLAITNNQLKQKIFEKLIFDPICGVLREYYGLIEAIEAAFREPAAGRSDRLKLTD